MKLLSPPFKYVIILSLAVFVSSCISDDELPEVEYPDFTTVPAAFDTTAADTTLELESGTRVYVMEEGEAGTYVVNSSSRVVVHYTGRLIDGTIFDSSYRNGNTTAVEFGINQVIPGFGEGIIGSKKGEKRVIRIPPGEGYTTDAILSLDDITTINLKNKTLIFDIELMNAY